MTRQMKTDPKASRMQIVPRSENGRWKKAGRNYRVKRDLRNWAGPPLSGASGRDALLLKPELNQLVPVWAECGQTVTVAGAPSLQTQLQCVASAR